mmetsp:Transcript_6988/g.11410  ORF Transcript_6988/g.11410 Transcript_6988/m.11410 type:complete len:96 (+) Transcript_6988:352-639(+)
MAELGAVVDVRADSSKVGLFVNIVIEEGAGVVAAVGLSVTICIDNGANEGANVIDAKVGCAVVGTLVASVELKVGTDVVGATVVGDIDVPILLGT